MPVQARPQVRTRFMNSDPRVHLGAFWELYLHEFATRTGVLLAVDVGNDGVGQRVPDFLLDGVGQPFWVEATVAGGDDFVDRDERKRVQQLYAAIERHPHRDFLIDVHVRRVGDATPGRKFVRQITRWLDSLDWQAVYALRGTGAPLPEKLIDHLGWQILVKASARRPELRGDPDAGAIGSRHEGWQEHRIEGNDRTVTFEGMKKFSEIESVHKTLIAKAGHGYSLEDRPFVIAALCAGVMVDDNDIAQALFGRLRYFIGSSASGELDAEFGGGGLWVTAGGSPVNTRVSAVLTVTDLAPGSMAIVEPTLWLNPWAAHPLREDAFPWRSVRIDETVKSQDVV